MNTVNLIEKADSLAKKKSLFSFNKESNYEKAIELYKIAFNRSQTNKDFATATKCATKIAELSKVLKNEYDVCDYYVKSASIYLRDNNYESAISAYKTAIENCNEYGKHSYSAKCYESIGEIYENREDYENAIEAYLNARDLYETSDNRQSTLVKLDKKLADLYILNNQISNAIIYLRDILRLYANTNYVLSNYVYLLTLCEFRLYSETNDPKLSTLLVEKIDICRAFQNTKEYILLSKTIEAFQSDDQDKFVNALVEYDNYKKLDDLAVKLFNKIKYQMINRDDNDIC